MENKLVNARYIAAMMLMKIPHLPRRKGAQVSDSGDVMRR